MADRRDNLMEPRLESLLDKVESKFTLVTLSAMRAREINDYYGHLGEGLGKIVPPQVTSISRKPLSIAMEEIREGKIIQGELKVVTSPEEQEADAIVAAIEALSVVADEPGPDAG
ncbi:MAG: DNA-directed RNA polymerase subunit omega [Acidimicrobiia bacterium]|jgi:DNA-directed RNA polymerase subunit omega|uniref:DNA-directed RNA polymerase n=1 Tax=freshwater metagenome TaxID=449393 RepID=A0A6J7JU89_9ZZZZ|nr:DNA-directed RNA polymerase subunit omega [Acidimicrobiia bacterium]MSW27462.1 DNA-directed RNA polymerase subunit omega [Actinomycetota bacterium]